MRRWGVEIHLQRFPGEAPLGEPVNAVVAHSFSTIRICRILPRRASTAHAVSDDDALLVLLVVGVIQAVSAQARAVRQADHADVGIVVNHRLRQCVDLVASREVQRKCPVADLPYPMPGRQDKPGVYQYAADVAIVGRVNLPDHVVGRRGRDDMVCGAVADDNRLDLRSDQ